MSLGEKLRQARMESGLSQRQLCGDEITRNMLSQIEHDTARPSMSTLQYLAGRLGLPVSYFLEEETAVSANIRCMELAWLQLGAGDYDAALRQLEEYRSPDSVCDREHALLLSLLYLNLAEQSIANQKTVYARQLLERAAELELEHPWLPELKNRRMLLLGRLGEMPKQEEIPNVDDVLMLRADAALAAGDHRRAAQILDAAELRTQPLWCLLRGRAAMGAKEYAVAAEYLKQAEHAFPVETIALLESCFRELGDFRSAYDYACRARELP